VTATVAGTSTTAPHTGGVTVAGWQAFGMAHAPPAHGPRASAIKAKPTTIKLTHRIVAIHFITNPPRGSGGKQKTNKLNDIDS